MMLALRLLVVWLLSFCFPIAGAALDNLDKRLSAALVFDIANNNVDSFISGLSGFSVTDESIAAKQGKDIECQKYVKVFAFGTQLANETVLKCGGSRVVVLDTQEAISDLKKKEKIEFGYIYTDQPVESHLKSISSRIPSIKSVGLLYSDKEVVEEFEKVAKKVSLNLISIKVPEGENAGRHFRRLLSQVDAILVTANSVIWPPKDIKGYLLASVRQGKLLIGGPSHEYVKSGVFAGVFTDYKALGNKVSEEVMADPDGEVRIKAAPHYFKYNDFLAKRLSIEVKKEPNEQTN